MAGKKKSREKKKKNVSSTSGRRPRLREPETSTPPPSAVPSRVSVRRVEESLSLSAPLIFSERGMPAVPLTEGGTSSAVELPPGKRALT